MKCRFCAEPAGFLRREHDACRKRHQSALAAVGESVQAAAVEGRAWVDIETDIGRRIDDGFIGRERLPELVMDGVERAVAHALDDDILNEEEEARITAFLGSLESAGPRLPANRFQPARERLVKAAVIRSLLQGQNPAARQQVVGATVFNFMKSEAPIWHFQDVDYLVVKKQVHYSGGSRGVGLRVAKGVYLRTGQFRGERQETEETTHADSGALCITTKHVYYAGATHRFRIRHDRVVSYTPLEDGFSLTRDRANARPEVFRTGDGWFAYNILANAQNLEP